MATRSQAPKPAGKPVLPRKETAPHCGVYRTCGSSSIRRVKRLLLCLAVGPWGIPPLLVPVTQAAHNSRAFSELLSQVRGQQETHARNPYHCAAPAYKPAC